MTDRKKGYKKMDKPFLVGNKPMTSSELIAYAKKYAGYEPGALAFTSEAARYLRKIRISVEDIRENPGTLP